MKPLYLIDISSFIFRAFYAIRPLTSPTGMPTNAVYGVATMLEKLISQAQPQNLVVIYDSKEPSFRKTIDPNYKANRSAPPEELIPQFDLVETLIKHLGIHSYRQSGIEADDIIATLTKHWIKAGAENEVVVVTGDKDLMQLVEPRVKVWDTMNDRLYNEAKVVEKFGLPPLSLRDYLALVGDSSDNIPGVTGIGPKTAVQLLTEFGSLDGVLEAAQVGKIAGKKCETLKNSVEVAKLSQTLVTLKEDVDVKMHGDFFKYEWKVSPGLISFLGEMGFKTLIAKWERDLQNGAIADAQDADREAQGIVPFADVPVQGSLGFGGGPTKKIAGGKFTTVDDERAFLELLEKIKKTGRFAIDLETTSLNPRAAVIVGYSIAVDDTEGFYIPVAHARGQQLPPDYVKSRLKPLLEDPVTLKIGQNLKYDFSVLLESGITPQGIEADTMVASYVIDASGSHGMDALSQRYLGYTPVSYEEVCGKGKTTILFDQVEIEVACRYSAEDAWVTWNLWRVFEPMIKEKNLGHVFSQIDLPLVPVLMRMESQGVSVDREWLGKLSGEFDTMLKSIEARIQSYADQPINLNSPKQVGPFLFEHLKLPSQGKTKTGYSTDADTLQTLAPLHEAPRLMLEYREISKLKGTYVDPLPSMIDPKTGKIHAHFHQAVTSTGRLSSSDPNLQNIPIRSERGRMIRRAFVASPGCLLISADYSQIELRILAHMSGDPELTRSFIKDEDVHRRTASEIYHVELDAVTDDQRAVAKAINFGLMYGKSAFGLAQELSISRTEAKNMIDRYFERYRGVKNLLDGLVQTAHETGAVQTLSGRVRALPEIHSKNQMVRSGAERMAMNAPIQGTAADLMKLAMIELDRQIIQRKLKGRLTIQVHDEVILDVPEAEVAEMSQLVTECMEKAMTLSVPLKVNVGVARNWDEA